MRTVEELNARTALFHMIKGVVRANLPTKSADVACAAIDLANAILCKRELSADIARIARFGIDDCTGYLFDAKRNIHAAYTAFADAVGKAVQA